MDDDEVLLPPILLPGYESRQQARAIIVLTALGLGLLWLLVLVATPGSSGPMFSNPWGPRDLIAVMVALAGIGMQVFGLLWMVRIYRRSIDVEPDQGNWRYRSR
jgi:hypothetical protein